MFSNIDVSVLMSDILPEVTPVREGDTVTLLCSPMMTSPPPMTTWLANGSDIGITTEDYTIGPVSSSTEIIYQCLLEATFTPTTNGVGLPPLVSVITTTVIDCKCFSCTVVCSVHVVLHFTDVQVTTLHFVVV